MSSSSPPPVMDLELHWQFSRYGAYSSPHHLTPTRRARKRITLAAEPFSINPLHTGSDAFFAASALYPKKPDHFLAAQSALYYGAPGAMQARLPRPRN